jgi:hypothetical protein
MLNWRPVYDIEQRTKLLELKEIDDEKHLKLLESEIAQLKFENKRLAELESRMDALLLSADPPLRHLPQPAPTERSPGGANKRAIILLI